MKKMSLAEAKARISELVDQAEHYGKRIIILRHGKPAAAIVPVDVAVPKVPRPKPLSKGNVEKSVNAFIDEFSEEDPDVSAVADLMEGRR